MYVTATVEAGAMQNAIAVPDSAVLRDTENQPFVYVEVGDNQFGRRSVSVGESTKGQTQITSGPEAGRPRDRGWQPVSPVREFVPALTQPL